MSLETYGNHSLIVVGDLRHCKAFFAQRLGVLFLCLLVIALVLILALRGAEYGSALPALIYVKLVYRVTANLAGHLLTHNARNLQKR